jgi:hypothetical protein
VLISRVYLLHRFAAAFLAISARCSGVSLRALSCPAQLSELLSRRQRWRLLPVLWLIAGRDPHDLYGAADHVGGTALASRILGHVGLPH